MPIFVLKKVKNQHVLNRRTDFLETIRIATLPKSYFIVIGITMESLKSTGQF